MCLLLSTLYKSATLAKNDHRAVENVEEELTGRAGSGGDKFCYCVFTSEP